MFQNWRQNMCLYNFFSLSITLSQSCCLLSIKVRAWKVFFFWSGFPGVTPERCSVAVCLWYAKPIYRLRRRAVASHHNSQPQDTSSLCPCALALCSKALHWNLNTLEVRTVQFPFFLNLLRTVQNYIVFPNTASKNEIKLRCIILVCLKFKYVLKTKNNEAKMFKLCLKLNQM